MLPSTAPQDYARGSLSYDRRPSQQPPPSGFYGSQRPVIELPRPLEPRPTSHHHHPLSETPSARNHHDAFKAPNATASEYRGPRQSLPGLRDILTPQSAPSHAPAHPPTWPPHSSAAPLPPPPERDYRRSELHPPFAGPGPARSGPPPYHIELPIMQANAPLRHPSQSVPVSPFTAYPDSRDYVDAHHASYLPPNNAPSPYTPTSEDGPYRSVQLGGEGPQGMPIAPGTAENQKKYLGVKEVPGEGSFHMYEGGFRIPTHVDGEQVNPAWGLTKANKPRKRLALACLDCREKKIKCEPGANSCLQCEKAKRPCRRAPMQPSQQDATSPSSWQNSAGSPIRKDFAGPTPQSAHEVDQETANKRRSREEPSPSEAPFKKHRSTSPIAVAGSISAGDTRGQGATAQPSIHALAGKPRKSLDWEEDPYIVDPEVAEHLASLYFIHVGNSTVCMFPQGIFFHWMRTCADKCQNERMVLYAILALGSLFAESTFSGYGKRCAQIAKDAVADQTGNHHMSAVQARLLVGLYYFAKGSYDAAWDLNGAAMRACASTMLRYNTEAGCTDGRSARSLGRNEYLLNSHQLAECKRRTFWSAFMMELYDDSVSCSVTLQDVFLRLPCADDVFEQGLKSEAPYYNNDIIDPTSTILTPASPVSPLARLVLLVAIWSDVRSFTNRAVHRPDSSYREAYEAQYMETNTRLGTWSARLPDHLIYSEANLERSVLGGYAGVFITMHTLYHFILVRLNRYVRVAQMSEHMPRNIRRAHHHAQGLLSIISSVRELKRKVAEQVGNRHLESVPVTSFVGYATISAIDVVSAGGFDSELRPSQDLINGGLELLRELAGYWNSARDQLRESELRFYQIQNICSRPYKAKGGAWLGREWGMKDPLEKEFIKVGHDCIYAAEGGGDDGYSRSYFDALRDSVQEPRSPARSRIASEHGRIT
ncbi:hypothetical protein D0862_03527 [Hortaea werneckii]|uniref:Zn(2)-C6 fungal-type domain-containing protein n=1 Tax=Hortaea werneckii TaxID=91943 RepID=A0A3M7H8W2_HORWE|nr:hypothetical protein D0862_03527 [Hortaea werneckii]